MGERGGRRRLGQVGGRWCPLGCDGCVVAGTGGGNARRCRGRCKSTPGGNRGEGVARGKGGCVGGVPLEGGGGGEGGVWGRGIAPRRGECGRRRPLGGAGRPCGGGGGDADRGNTRPAVSRGASPSHPRPWEGGQGGGVGEWVLVGRCGQRGASWRRGPPPRRVAAVRPHCRRRRPCVPRTAQPTEGVARRGAALVVAHTTTSHQPHTHTPAADVRLPSGGGRGGGGARLGCSRGRGGVGGMRRRGGGAGVGGRRAAWRKWRAEGGVGVGEFWVRPAW